MGPKSNLGHSIISTLKFPKARCWALLVKNGAGKSTLLKILSKITYPTQGEVLLRGSVSSLLEVGTGFHPELSGRENIFLNGNILGLSRKEVKQRFAEIVDFSGIEDFIDTPVKHYSSGMYVRLAFSVAANLSPDILLIDEVLAVGDAAFQKKCLDRTNKASTEEGRTVLFVSHNMGAIRGLCDEVIWLKKGAIHQKGEPEVVTTKYLKEFENLAQNTPVAERDDRLGTGDVKLSKLQWQTRDELLISGKAASLQIGYESKSNKPLSGLNFRLNIFKENGEYLTTLSNDMTGASFTDLPHQGEVTCTFDQLPLLAGNYYIISNVLLGGVRTDQIDRALSFSVLPGDRDQSGAPRTALRAGVRVNQKWRIGE
ncbi:MAG: ABC transporter ATP-binding protein [Owenweeksia sp.]|nr:ABC transporter ATP-binding protein [Owenweeksia sp.]